MELEAKEFVPRRANPLFASFGAVILVEKGIRQGLHNARSTLFVIFFLFSFVLQFCRIFQEPLHSGFFGLALLRGEGLII